MSNVTVHIDVYHAGALHGQGRWASEDVPAGQETAACRRLEREYRMTYGGEPLIEADGVRIAFDGGELTGAD